MNYQEKVIQVLKDVSKNNQTPGAEDSLFESGYLDSFARADAASGLEAAFGIKIPDSDLTPRKFDSIAKLDHQIRCVGATALHSPSPSRSRTAVPRANGWSRSTFACHTLSPRKLIVSAGAIFPSSSITTSPGPTDSARERK